MKNHRFLWLRNRTTDNRKCEKARNIKEKRTIEMFNTVSRPPAALLSSASADSYLSHCFLQKALFRGPSVFFALISLCVGLEIGDEALSRGGEAAPVLHRKSDLPVVRLCKRPYLYPVRDALQYQLRQYADAQPPLGHRHYRVVLPRGEPYFRVNAALLQQLRHF